MIHVVTDVVTHAIVQDVESFTRYKVAVAPIFKDLSKKSELFEVIVNQILGVEMFVVLLH